MTQPNERPLALVTGASSGIGYELARLSQPTAMTWSSPRPIANCSNALPKPCVPPAPAPRSSWPT